MDLAALLKVYYYNHNGKQQLTSFLGVVFLDGNDRKMVLLRDGMRVLYTLRWGEHT